MTDQPTTPSTQIIQTQRPPFNAAARERAGMGPEWYEPLITPTKGEGGGKAKDGAAAE